MCFPGYWDANELIRRGYDTACLFFELSNGCQIGYELDRSHHVYYLQENDNIEQWTDCDIPDRIVEMLGLILDTESQVILNVIDKDVPLPFIKTSPKFNASLIRAVVEPAKITDFFARTNEHLKEVDAARTIFKSRMNAAHEAASVLEFKNVDTLRIDKRHVDNLITLVDVVVTLQQAVDNVKELVCSPPTEVLEPRYAAQLINLLDTVIDCNRQVGRIVDVKRNKPLKVASPDVVKSQLSLLDSLENTTLSMSVVAQTQQSCPTEVNLPEVYPSLELLNYIAEVVDVLQKISSAGSEVHSKEREMNALSIELEKIKSEVGVCPTCGRLL